MSDLAQIGPVQLMSVGFEPGANFEGRIADELAKLQREGTIRVLDLLFVARDTDSDELVVLEHQEESMGRWPARCSACSSTARRPKVSVPSG